MAAGHPPTGDSAVAIAASVIQQARRVLELFVLKQLLDEVRAWIKQFVGLFSAMGQDQPRLQLDQRGRHFQKIAHRVDVNLLQHLQVRQELLGDRRHANVRDLHLVFAHQIEQQVERTAEYVQFDAKIHARNGTDRDQRRLGQKTRTARLAVLPSCPDSLENHAARVTTKSPPTRLATRTACHRCGHTSG